MKTESPRIRIALTVFAALLTWLVVSRSFAAYLVGVSPAAALWLNPANPAALVDTADRALNSRFADRAPAAPKDATDDTAGLARATAYSLDLNAAFKTIGQNRSVDLSSIRARAEAALRYEPLNAHALRILGQIADIANDDADAAKFMRAAARLSLHEQLADYWLLRKGSEARDYKAVAYYADVLLRGAPGTGTYVVPVLAKMADDRGSNQLLKSVLADDPPWRAAFFAMLPGVVADARTPLDLLGALRTSATPPTAGELAPYLQFLVGRKLYDLAYYTWLQFLSSAELRHAGLLFNGDFEFPPSGLPFNWVIEPGSGVTIDIVPRTDKSGEHALLVDFQYGRVDYHSVKQLVLLPPGRYRLAGKYQGELVGPRGLRWRVACAENPSKHVGESPMISGVASAWRAVGFDFTVPGENCRAQYVMLDLDARMASEQLVSGSFLFDDLQISRVSEARPNDSRLN